MKARHLIIPALFIILLASCGPAVEVTPITFPPTSSAPTEQPSPLPTPTLAIHSLTICAASQPADIFLYNDPSFIKTAILSAIYDGPIEVVDYSYQPVILTKLPSLADGDAVIEPVPVKEGDPVLDSSGALTVLQAGVVVRPAGCRTPDCAAPYQSGTSLQMDRMRVTFHLRPGVEWTDGAPVTAADSVFSYAVATNPDTLYGNNGLVTGSARSVTGTAGYKALDDLTTQWTGLPGFLDPNYQLNFFIPLPEHQLSTYAGSIADMAAANEVLYSPLGWGAYKVTGWDPGKQISLEPNPHYFRTAEGLPYYNRLTFKFIGTDPQANLSAFQAGECDLLLQDSLPETPSPAMLDLANQGKARLYADPQPVFEHLTFNLTPADPALPPLFADPQMRKAVAACLDRTALVDSAYSGLVQPLDLAFPSDHPLMAGASLSYPFDQARGTGILKGLGWKDTDGDGIREAHGISGIPDGTLLQFVLTTTDTTLRGQVSSLVAEQLKACGMTVTLKQVPIRDLFAQSAEADLAGRRFEAAELSSPMTVEALCGLGLSSQIPAEANGWSGSNISGYSNSLFDQACATVQASLPGTPEYTTSRQTALRIFSEDLPSLPLFSTAGFSLARADLAGILTGSGQASELQNIESFKPGP